MLLAIDVGNSNITLGVFQGDALKFVARIATDKAKTGDQYAIELRDMVDLYGVSTEDFSGAIISSVVPVLASSLKQAVTKLTGFTPIVLGPGIKTGLNIKIDNPGQLGADLVAGAVAAIHLYPCPCIIYDLGTATTITVIDKNQNFIGGAICAGIAISLDALVTRTAQLPQISIETPDSAIGKNTIDSMKSGLVFGQAALLDGMTERMEDQLGEKATVIATGGLAKEIVANCKRNIVYSDNLILLGLKMIYDKNK
ncbi:MAG: pantothenate kinase [Clostridiales bacterium 43-6]|nr:MAG: pantothenate kinase [Clostridiales bacterium 43-6]